MRWFMQYKITFLSDSLDVLDSHMKNKAAKFCVFWWIMKADFQSQWNAEKTHHVTLSWEENV